MKKTLIRISLLLVSLLMLLSVFACGDEETPVTPKEQVNVIFEIGRGSFVDEEYSGIEKVDKGSALKSYPEVERKNYKFDGWYLDEECTEPCDASYKFNENTTVYAGWKKIETHPVITFDTNGGKFSQVTFGGTVTVNAGETITSYPTAKRTGYVFGGWYFDKECKNLCPETYEFDESLTLYAGWIDSSLVCTVTFDVSRANYGTKAPDKLTVRKGDKISCPTLIPERADSTFYGWCIVNGTSETLWNFNSDTVESNIRLVAVFRSNEDPGTGDETDTCEHDFEITEQAAPTCQANGKIVQKCKICRKTVRITYVEDPSLKKLEHKELEETVEPSCAVDGYTTIYCPNGCGLSSTFTLPATGDHEYDQLGWFTAIQPTKYVNGTLQNNCIVCGGASVTKTAYYNALPEDLEAPDVSFLYTGGSYVNERFVNIATLGRVEVSSYFTTAIGANINDGDALTFWNADTYVEGADYTSDWFTIDFMQAYDIGAIKFTLPNYYAWELGEGCYVSYDVEYWDAATEAWVYLGEVSDKNATSVGQNCEFMIELSEPINTNKIRAKVTHAGRYTPAVIYELEVYAKTVETERLPVAINAQGTYTVSGKYNDWVNGAGALSDNTTVTYWTTDARYNPTPWAMVEFAVDKYIACVQFSTKSIQNRVFKLEVYENGEWTTVGEKYTVPEAGTVGGNVISNTNGICTFNVEIERTISKIRLTITNEPQYWESLVYDITPYTVVEQAYGEATSIECKHKNPRLDSVVEPTCTSAGYTIEKCACGFEIRTDATDKLGHDFGKYTIDVPATATALGTKVATCKNGCGATNTIAYEENYDAPVITPYLHNAPAAWAQSLDDGNYLETYVWANEFYAKYGYKATVMMSITYVDALVDLWNGHFEKGVFDLGSHSYNHTSIYAGAKSEGALLEEVVKAQYWFRNSFKGQELLVFAAPLGATSDSVAEYLVGPLAANRNGGDTGIMYNLIENLTERKKWGDLNSYISKSDQTEGEYVFVNKTSGEIYKKGTDEDGNVVYNLVESYKHTGINLIFDYETMSFVDRGYDYAGTYYFDGTTYKYDYVETGSYSFDGANFSFVGDDSGEYKMVKATVGSYEKGVEQLVAVNGFTVECIHSLGWGSIYSSYESTISKFEHMARFGVWGCSYNQVVQYVRESQNAKVEITERTEDTITLSVTDSLDDFMFNQALTVKVDIPDSWTSVSVTQNGKEIPFITLERYKTNKYYDEISCAIEEGYLYVDVIPDGGDVVITSGDKDTSVNDYKDRVTVSFETNGGDLESDEYEAKVVKGEALASMPTPEKYGFKFMGWYTDAECTVKADETATYSESITLYALWEEIPVCTDGSYNHKWTDWLPSSNTTETRGCSKCDASETREIEVEE